MNELGDVLFQIVSFSNRDDMVEAFAALYASRRDMFLSEAEKLGYGSSKFSQATIDAWSYMYYVNPGQASENLQERGPDLIYTPSGRWDSSAKYQSPRRLPVSDLARRASATSAYLRGNAYFDDIQGGDSFEGWSAEYGGSEPR